MNGFRENFTSKDENTDDSSHGNKYLLDLFFNLQNAQRATMQRNMNPNNLDRRGSTQKNGRDQGVPKLSLEPATPIPTSGWLDNATFPTHHLSHHNNGGHNINGMNGMSGSMTSRLPQIIPDNNSLGGGGGSLSARDGPFKRPTNPPHHAMRLGANPQSNLTVTRMKDEPEEKMSCMGGLSGMPTFQHNQVPANTPAMGFRTGGSNMDLQLRSNTPAMSEISSINANTPRGSTISQHQRLSGYQRNSDQYLQPGLPGGRMMRGNSWTTYQVLPEVGQGQHQGHHVSSATTQNVGHHINHEPNMNLSQHSRSSFTPSVQLPDFPQNDSNQQHSTPQRGQKRARSTSTQSSDFDILSVIRSSPSNLRPAHFAGSTRGSSMNSSPQPGQLLGSCCHLDARLSAMGPPPMLNPERRVNNFMVQQQQQQPQENSEQWEVYRAMSQLEQNMCTGQQSNMANHMIITQPDPCLFKQQAMYAMNNHHHQMQNGGVGLNNGMSNGGAGGMTYKQEPHDIYQQHHSPMSANGGGGGGGNHHSNHNNNMHVVQMNGNHGSAVPPAYPHNNMSPYGASQQNIGHNGVASDQHEIKEEPTERTKDDNNKSEWICEWIDCNMVFAEQSELVTHLEKTHIEQKRSEDVYVCYWNNCGRAKKPFNARYKLLIHMRVHSLERPNKCTFEGCEKAFSRLENLKIHLRSHTGERPYECQFENCTKAFSNSSDRAKHSRTHADTKPYGCTVEGCTKRYTDPSSLRKHAKTHTNKDTHVRKKARAEGELNGKGGTNMLGNCMTVQSMKNGQQETQPQKMYQRGMQFGKALAYEPNQVPAPQLPANMAHDNYDRRVGGGFNNPAAFKSSLVVPRNRGTGGGGGGPELPQQGLHGTRVPMVGESMPPPPPYPEQQDQWQQQPPTMPTPIPEMEGPASVGSSMEQSPGPDTLYEPAPGPYLSAELNQMGPQPSQFSRTPRHYVPNEGNAPLSQDYTSMPCHVQHSQALPFGQQRDFQMSMTIDETLKNLPFDTVPFQRAVSNHSGGM